jgi:copper chaperone CopZ
MSTQRLRITGMTCDHCVRAVTRELSTLPGVTGVQVTLESGDVTVSSETKRIANGITARIVRDTVTQDGELVEDTFDWYAQDETGTVWYMGEDTAEFSDGKIETRAGSFEAGVDGALPGIIMPADPQVGMRYRQEYYKGQAEDNGEVLSVEEQVGVPYKHFDQAVLTKDTNALEPAVL